MNFNEKLHSAGEKNNSLLCVGLDSDFEKLPALLKKGSGKPTPPFGHPSEGGGYSSRQRGEIILNFNKAIIDATKDFVCAYKPNTAFYEALGGRGLEILKQTIEYIHEQAPDIVVIADAKRADIGSTNEQYAEFIFSYLNADAVTIHPYLGKEAALPFLDQKEKGIFVLCRTSNKGADEFQDLILRQAQGDKSEELYKLVARNVVQEWNFNGNCGLVVGAMYPEEIKEVRAIVGDMPILVPGIGAQGGNVEKTVHAGMTEDRGGIIINSSRGIIFAGNGEDFADVAGKEAVRLRDEINSYR